MKTTHPKEIKKVAEELYEANRAVLVDDLAVRIEKCIETGQVQIDNSECMDLETLKNKVMAVPLT